MVGCCGVPLLLFAVLLFALWWFWGPGVGWRYMAPYRSLVARHATQQQVIKEIGKPAGTARNRSEFDGWLHSFSRANTARIWSGGEVFVYWADPWHDQDGFVVYLAFDSKGRASGTQLCGHANH